MPNCTLCGEPMPEGEQMFKYHGYSGSCPKPPLHKPASSPDEYAWLVEMKDGGPKYYSVSATDEEWPWGGFDSDVNQALRFARKKDAEDFITAHGWTKGHVYASEHSWAGDNQ